MDPVAVDHVGLGRDRTYQYSCACHHQSLRYGFRKFEWVRGKNVMAYDVRADPMGFGFCSPASDEDTGGEKDRAGYQRRCNLRK